nr:hypothetical protein [Heyndrickxia oleronia]
MIVKELTIPYKLLMDVALLRRLRPSHPKLAMIEEDLTRRKVGYRGEQNLLYHLGFLPPQNQKIFLDSVYHLKIKPSKLIPLF